MLDGVDGLLNHGNESSGRTRVEDQSPDEAASFRMRDVLDREAIDKIEPCTAPSYGRRPSSASAC